MTGLSRVVASYVGLSLLGAACGIPLLDGRFETTTDVQDVLNLANDAAQMKEADAFQATEDIYKNGSNPPTNGQPGLSLQSLSLNSKEKLKHSPMYNIFRHAFLVLGEVNEGESEGSFDGNPIHLYADTLVNDLFQLGIDDIETEAAIVLSVWMMAASEMFEVAKYCQSAERVLALQHLDLAAAYWIGEGQSTGSNEGGHLLYNLAENAGERFGQDEGETLVNTQLIDTFLTLQTELLANKCNTEEGFLSIRKAVKSAISLMTVPLVQNFIHHTMNVGNEGGSSFVELYALATIPRVAACDPQTYDDELHLDVLREMKATDADASIAALQAAYSCLDVTCGQIGSYLEGTVPQCQDPASITTAGYTTSRAGARSKSMLDRDIKEIDVFLRLRDFESAQGWYAYGWNSFDYSLKDLASNQVVPTTTGSSYMKTFVSYYQGNNFADDAVLDRLLGGTIYSNASREQIRNAVISYLKHVVAFVTSATALQYSIEQCSGDKDTALEYWDFGSLLYVGSMEGPELRANILGGELLFTTAKELCVDFGTCDSPLLTGDGLNDAAVNTAMMGFLEDAAALIDGGQCDAAATSLTANILPTMLVPLLQGTLRYASINAKLLAGSDDVSQNIGDSFMRSVVPIVNESAPQVAAVLEEQLSFKFDSNPVDAGFGTVGAAIRSALQNMPTDCADLGQLESEAADGNMCTGPTDITPADSPTNAPVATPTTAPVQVPVTPGTPDSIAFGRYIFEDLAVADGDGSFALDVRDMYNAASVDVAGTIYEEGQNAVASGLSGVSGFGTTTLASFSREASRFMIDDHLFNVYRFALYDDEDLEDGAGGDFLYADDVVIEAIDGGRDKELAAEAAVVMNVFMVITHQLYEAVRVCRDGNNPIPLIDSAVALWIGKGQEEGKYGKGWMMYSIAQTAAQYYGLPEGEAAVNRELMTLFNEAQDVGRTCLTDDDSDLDMYFKVQEIVRKLSKPLITTLLFHLAGSGKNMVELYAVSVVPQGSACNELLGQDLQEAFFEDYTQNRLADENVLEQLTAFLRCQRITSDDLKYGNVDTKLKTLLDTMTTRLDYYLDASNFIPMAGYTPNTDVYEISRLDLDIQEIMVLTRAAAYVAAQDVYEYGHNAIEVNEPNRCVSLQSLATTRESDGVLVFELFKSYYGSENYADDIVESALGRVAPYASATRGETEELVMSTLQTMVTFVGILTKMQSSFKNCVAEKIAAAQSDWDSAVALYIGSTEGLLAGGLLSGDGALTFALANELCDDFGMCEPAGEATINDELLNQFAVGREAVKDGNCDHLDRLNTWEIKPRLTVPLIQGTISFALQNLAIDSRDPDTLATAHILAKSVIPLVDSSNSTSAATIENALGDFGTMSSGQPVDDVVTAFAYALRGMGINCEDIGTPVANPELSLCRAGGDGTGGNVPDQAPVADTATDLGDGLYVTTTYVQDRANIAGDISDMEEAVGSSSYNLANILYRDGKNSEVYDTNGKFLSLRSLQRFSTEETLEMLDEPLFNIFMFALQDDQGQFMSRDVRLYADSLVEEAFSKINTENRLVPVEAAVALNLWMHIAHVLYKTLKDCKNAQIRDEDGVHSLDIAVAYWIGDDQVAGNSEGHSLYALAERMGELFDLESGGQSRTNTNILRMFSEAKHEISLPGACSSNPSSYLRLSRIVNKITSLMSVPLIQGLINSLRADDRDRVSLYGHAVIPLAAGCSPGVFEYLKDKVLGMNYNIIEVEDIVLRIREMFPCLDLSCSDIGVHEDEMTGAELTCKDPEVFTDLAGYKPSSDVREYARLDLDMRQLDILLQMKAYEAAENLYTHGKHVEGPNGGSLSLLHLATTSERAIVPGFDAFARYYGGTFANPSSYADEIIKAAFSNSGSGTGSTLNTNLDDAQRRTIVLKTTQVMVMYYGGLQALYEAVSDCQDASSFRNSGSSDSWDRGAAMLIGSLEGTQTNGTLDGYMYYDLAQEYCVEFGTCVAETSGVGVNERLISLLYTGRGAGLGKSCSGLRKAADEIANLLLIPVIQGALISSTRLSSSSGSASLQRAEGYVYSRAVLPLVGAANRDAASTIESQLGFPAPRATRNTAAEVFSAFASVYPAMDIDCQLIGEVEGNNACTGVKYKNGNLLWIIVGSAGGVIVLGVMVKLCYKKKASSNLPENNPKFFTAEAGELNHSMDLLEKAFSSNTRPRTGKSAETVALAEDMYNDASPQDDDDFDEARALKSQMESTDPDII